VVERQLPKLNVVGSIPISRSSRLKKGPRKIMVENFAQPENASGRAVITVSLTREIVRIS
jgi:hypothetical protein